MIEAPPPPSANAQALAYELLMDGHGCASDALASAARMRALCDALVAALGVTVLHAPLLHAFPATAAGPGGVTALYLLSESHLALHTWPERHTVLLSLCCCRPLPADEVLIATVRSHCGAADVSTRRIERGLPDSPPQHPQHSQHSQLEGRAA